MKRRSQFTLRTLLIVTALLAFAFGYIRWLAKSGLPELALVVSLGCTFLSMIALWAAVRFDPARLSGAQQESVTNPALRRIQLLLAFIWLAGGYFSIASLAATIFAGH